MITQKLEKPEGLSLYMITDQLSDALAEVRVDEETGELVGFEAVEALKCSAHDKIVSIARHVQNQNTLLAAMKEAKKNIDTRIKSAEARIDGLKRAMSYGMQQLNAKRIEEGDIAISLRRSTSVVVYDESMLSDKFFTVKTTKSVSKTAIKEALVSGKDVQGAKLIDSLNVQIK